MASPKDESPDPKRAGSDAPETPRLSDSVLTELLEAGLSSRDTIGPYRLLRPLGEGGMGRVYEAEQSEPVRRRVAVKVVKEGLHSKEVLARFDTERQALAVMDHPGIATVFDGGCTDTGRPYFAMELVRGDPIVTYCDRHRLDTEARLRLFVDVCRAVQHAHQKGVIHRDLKPSNVLVQEIDGRPQVKVIDFGVAKAVGRPLTDATVLTVRQQLLGTPAYMSPEQLDPSGLDIDTRTDVYSLGVLLYQLLTGELPFGGSDPKTSIDELRRRVLSDEPMRPSRRISTLARERYSEERHGGLDRRSWNRQLRGDLDWITLKALEKDRARRFASASELAADIERHLANEPVSAGPPGVGYRVRKFVRRHRLGVAMAGAFSLLLIVSIVLISVALVRARRSEEEARARALEAEEVRDFLVDVFDASDPYRNRGEEPTVSELLERGIDRIEVRLHGQPGSRVLMLATLGRVMSRQGLHERADQLLAEAEREASGLPGRDDMVATVLLERAGPLVQLGKPDEALEAATRGLELRRRRFDEVSREVRGALRTKGWVQLQLADWDGAIETLHRALAIDAQLGREQPLDTADLERLLGFALHRLGDPEAETHVRRAYDLYLEADPDHPNLAWGLSELASFASADGRLDEAVALYEQALALQRRILGEDHLATADTLNDLGVAYWNGQRLDEAQKYWLEALAVRERHLSEDNPALIQSLNNLALISRAQLHLEDAERYYRRALEIGDRVYGADSRQTASVRSNLALLLKRERRAAEAEPLARRSLAVQRDALGETASGTFFARLSVVDIRIAEGEILEAVEELRRLRRDVVESGESSGVLLEDVSSTLARALTLLPELPAAEIEGLLEEMTREAERPDEAPDRRDQLLMTVHRVRAVARGREGNPDEASQAYQALLRLEGQEDLPVFAHYWRARILALLGRRGDALSALVAAREGGFAEFPPESDPALASLHGEKEYEALVRDYRRPWTGSGVSNP